MRYAVVSRNGDIFFGHFRRSNRIADLFEIRWGRPGPSFRRKYLACRIISRRLLSITPIDRNSPGNMSFSQARERGKTLSTRNACEEREAKNRDNAMRQTRSRRKPEAIISGTLPVSDRDVTRTATDGHGRCHAVCADTVYLFFFLLQSLTLSLSLLPSLFISLVFSVFLL